jgi:hypothetical protein
MGPTGAWRRPDDRELFRPLLGRVEHQLRWRRRELQQFRRRLVFFVIVRRRRLFGAVNAFELLVS